MTQERITETTDQHGNTHTTRVIETGPSNSGGGMAKWAFLLILVVALAVGAVLMTQANNSEIAMNNAVAEAAGDVGEAAGQVGEAAQDAADSLGGGE